MCPKTSKTPIFLIGGVCFVIVLVGITGITLINNINLSNIIRLNEKVASDSVSANDNQIKEMNYANNHPKNVYKFDITSFSTQSTVKPIETHASPTLSADGDTRNPEQIRNEMSSLVDGGSVSVGIVDENSIQHSIIPKVLPVVWQNTEATKRNKTVSSSANPSTKNANVINDGSTVLSVAEKKSKGKDTINTLVFKSTPAYKIQDTNSSMIDYGKREHVVKMMVHAWQNYKLYAWGKNELKPLSQRPHSGSIFGAYDLGATIVDGLDTLYLMGLDNEYKEGRDWIERKFSLDNISADLSVFETNIRFVGGLLTLYSFTGDNLYKEKAQHIADKLLPAFQTPTGIPYALVNTKTGMSKNYGWASGGSSILSEFGTLHLEFAYLSDITGNPLYRERVQAIRQVLKEIEKPKGLYPNFLNPKTGKWGQLHMSLGALGDSFYEYLLKAWLQSGQTDEEAREMFDEAMIAIIEKMVRTSPNGLTYVSDLKFDRLEHKMDHLACFSGGLFALGANTRQNENADKFMDIGKGITNTCHESYIRTATKLGPEAFRFSDSAEARALKSQEKYYILRPETFESYFILWRLTHDQKYRDWGWEAVQALEKQCRTPHGYCGIKNVYQEVPQKDDVQQSFFLAETLKYLYLLFSDDSLLPLDEWVFNTEAHPLPIRGANIYYRQAPTTTVSSNTP
ncbi:mannosyl-oligosaccharide alpha-1,2-mannosidase IA isoform X2 [Teleopsis dalmanni]|uniref:mannosyl-oligosaccharide alpha-1,2-mannosidase IA isoform X2 n=1 Tax=Teleopsis dalmanni TaxID=139649 RepID=UPI0018CFEE1F|nr:mannosyl-oligosaccharide alpha-1,2-mannosidase IA isoform X2 [Teleopsis dalmanni]